MRQAHLGHRGAHGFEKLDGFIETLGDARLEAFAIAADLFDETDAHTREVTLEALAGSVHDMRHGLGDGR